MSTPIGDATDRDLHPAGNGHHAAPPPAARPHDVAGRLTDAIAGAHHVIDTAAHRASQLLAGAAADLEAVTTPQGKRLMEAVARAVHAGVPDAEVEGMIAGLHGLANKAEGQRPGTGPQPQFPPAPAADGSM